jgi:alpha-tubulin suppressor-like RCC1 family protein
MTSTRYFIAATVVAWFLAGCKNDVTGPTFALQVAVAGSGTVTSSSGDISCTGAAGSTSGTCTADYKKGTSVTLSETPAGGSVFGGWSGSGINCLDSSPCVVTMDEAQSVTATFMQQFTLTVSGAGSGTGTVTSDTGNISCTSTAGSTSGTCLLTVNSGRLVTLTATPTGGSVFDGWSGSGITCAGTAPCVVTMDQAKDVTASFTLQFALTVVGAGTGTGTVTSGSPAINCTSSAGTLSGTCTASYNSGTVVTLTATSAGGSVFDGWSGTGTSCQGTSPCVLTMDQARTVTATFTQHFALTIGGTGTRVVATVTSSPAGLNCILASGAATGTCSGDFGSRTVTLTLSRWTGTTVTGWSGTGSSCSGDSCQVTMDQGRNVIVGLGGRAGDVNGDGLVDQIDLDRVKTAFGQTDLRPEDVNRDSLVDIQDLGIVSSNWTGGLTVATVAASAVTSTTAVLNGTMTAGPNAATVWFEWGTSPTLASPNTTTPQAISPGTAAVPFSANVNGLTANTIYYFRAMAANGGGTANGDIISLTPPGPVSLTLVGGGTGGTAQLTSTPAGIDCTVAPGTATGSCGATFGSGTPVTLNATPWTGTTVTGWSGTGSTCSANSCQVTMDQARTVTVDLGGRAGDVNADGLVDQIDVDRVKAAFGRTDLPPEDVNRSSLVDIQDLGIVLSNWTGGLTVTTVAASAVTGTDAVLNGTMTAGSNAATVWFEWGTSPTLANPSTTTPQAISAGTALVPFSASVSGLTANTTYYFRAVASNNGGIANGDIFSFNSATFTPGLTVTGSGTGSGRVASSPSGIDCTIGTNGPTGSCSSAFTSGTSVTLNVTPWTGATVTGWSGTGSSCSGDSCQVTMDQARTVTVDLGGVAGDVNGDGLVDQIDLDRVKAAFGQTDLRPEDINRDGLVDIHDLGIVLSDWTGGLTVTTVAASSVTSTSAALNGSMTAGPNAATVWFEWGTSPTLSNPNTTAPQAIAAGTAVVPFSTSASGLTANTTYYFRAVASNSGGTASGDTLTFTTPGPVTLTVVGGGTGGVARVTSDPTGIDCTIAPGTGTGSCSTAFSSGTVTLTLKRWTGTTVTGWNGTGSSCSGDSCQVTMDQVRTVTVDLGGRAGDVNGDGLVDQIDLDRVKAAFGQTDLRPEDINRDGLVDIHDLGIVLSNWTGGLTVTTVAASDFTDTSATLNGSMTAGSNAATVWFEWGTSPTLANANATTPQAIAAGTSVVPFSASVSGLAANTTYYFRAVASNNGGTAKGDSSSFSTALPSQTMWVSVDAGNAFACGINDGGQAYCWGSNGSGQLGIGTVDALAHHAPTAVLGSHSFVSITAGAGHACGLTDTHAAYCWGHNYRGRLGAGGEPDGSFPQPTLVSGGYSFSMVSAGHDHTCALATTGEAYCWGSNSNGQLGIGSSDSNNHLSPEPVAGGTKFLYISAGMNHTCGVATDGTGYCWGDNGSGQLGDGSQTERHSPTLVSGGLSFKTISAGVTHTCALAVSDVAYCWGANSNGQLGSGSTVVSSVPVVVTGGQAFGSLSAGGSDAMIERHTCGVTTAGTAFCWGANSNGQLGNGSYDYIAHGAPEAVAGDLNFQRITTGGLFSCGVTTARRAYCWGSDSTGQLGNGEGGGSTSPVQVIEPS